MKKSDIEILVRGVLVRNGWLLVCHNKRKDNVFLPGGHLEFGERAKDALRREIAEETGKKCSAGRFLGASEHSFIYKGRRVCEINLVFEMAIAGASPRRPVPSRESRIEFFWLPLAKLAGSRLQPYPMRQALPRWLKSRTANWSSSV